MSLCSAGQSPSKAALVKRTSAIACHWRVFLSAMRFGVHVFNLLDFMSSKHRPFLHALWNMWTAKRDKENLAIIGSLDPYGSIAHYE